MVIGKFMRTRTQVLEVLFNGVLEIGFFKFFLPTYTYYRLLPFIW